MRFARCKADEVGLYAGDRSRRMGRGAFVDLAEIIVSAVPRQGKTPARPPETLRDVLGSRLDAFEVFDADTMEQAMAEAARRDAREAVASMTATDDTPGETSPAATPEAGSDVEPTSAAE